MLVAVGAAVDEAFGLQTAPVASVVRPIPTGEGLLLAFSLRHQPDIWPQLPCLLFLFLGFSLALSSSSESATNLDFAHVFIAASLIAIAFFLSFSAVRCLLL